MDEDWLVWKSVLNIHWKDWCWSWNSNTLATWWEEPSHWKGPWCWERLKAGGEGDDRGWDGWMASLTRWTWVWASFGNWWWTGSPGVLQSMGSQRVEHNWETELNWTDGWGSWRLSITTGVWMYLTSKRKPSRIFDKNISTLSISSSSFTRMLSKHKYGRKIL